MKEHRSHNKPVLTGALLRRAAALALAALLALGLTACQDLAGALTQQPAASTVQPAQPADGSPATRAEVSSKVMYCSGR